MFDDATQRVRLIDFEYGAYNPRAFDIANHFCEMCGFESDWSKFPTRKQQCT
jgi:ethanolamine kinase